ncbi:MAG: hypothetical protein Kow0029_26790 [Candidatus Rifleibacteriota bacterium]
MKISDRVTYLISKRGFNLAEVVVASAVIALMMVSLIGYVQSASSLWKKSHEIISLSNEGISLLDFIEREIWEAKSITSPAIGDSASSIVYSKIVSDYQEPTPNLFELDFEIAFNATTGSASARILTTTPKWTDATFGAAANGWSIDTSPGSKKIVLSRYNFDIARNLKSFSVARTANRLLEVKISLEAPKANEETPRELTFKRIMIMP